MCTLIIHRVQYMKRYTFKIKILATIALLATGMNALADSPNNPTPSTKPVIQHIVVFGDSLSDTGNFYNFTDALSKIPFSPIKSPIPTKPYDYRFSNGWTWSEYIAQNLGWLSQKGQDKDIDDISYFSKHPTSDKLAVFAYAHLCPLKNKFF